MGGSGFVPFNFFVFLFSIVLCCVFLFVFLFGFRFNFVLFDIISNPRMGW